MKITQRQLRRIIREELQLELFGMFSKDPEWLSSNGMIKTGKLSPEQKKLYSIAKDVGDRGGRKNEINPALKDAGINVDDMSDDDEALVGKSYLIAKSQWATGQM